MTTGAKELSPSAWDLNGNVALVTVDGEWALAGPRHAQPGRIEPLIPNSLPRQIETVPAPPATAEVDTAPRCAWMSEFVL